MANPVSPNALALQLNVLEGQGRFIVNSSRQDAPLNFPPLFFGDSIPVELRSFRKSVSGELVAVDLTDYEITLSVGPSNVRPELGFWQLTTITGTSMPIASRASANDVQEALVWAFGPGLASVSGSQGSYVITLSQPGIWTLPTVSFQGNTLSGVILTQITPGTTTTPAQYRVEVLEVAPARIIPADWSPGDQTPVNNFTQVSGRLWKLEIDWTVSSGFFTLTIDGVTTGFLPYNADAFAVQIALIAIGKTALVQNASYGALYISFGLDVVAASVNSQLDIAPFKSGVLDLNSTGIRELLNGVQFTSVKLAVSLLLGGQVITAASADFILQMPINQPGIVVVDSPTMAGLSLAFSEDGAYLLTYQNGALVGGAPLAGPSDVPAPGPSPPVGITLGVSADGTYLLIYQNGTLIGEAFLNAPA